MTEPAAASGSVSLPGPLRAGVEAALEDWRRGGKVRRLWQGDASLWTGRDEGRWLGWLRAPEGTRAALPAVRALAEEVRREGAGSVLLLGMGGSSLCPDVLARTFGPRPGWPELFVLDSTDPAQVLALGGKAEPGRSLFVVSSKSGTTLEPDILLAHFLDRAKRALGVKEAARRFVAITDPGSKLEALARREGFRAVLHGVPEIGGRFSALSLFGMVPAALMGLDAGLLLDRAGETARACGPETPEAQNPGLRLGAVLGAAAALGLDKLTLISSMRLRALGGWLEQLVAESTGKEGKAVLPVDGERIGPPGLYGEDRLFVSLALEGDEVGDEDEARERALDRLEEAGRPVLRLRLRDPHDLAREFFRWEFATAVAGSLLGVNPFDQPDVEASKVATRRLTSEYAERGALPAEEPLAEGEGVRLFADPRNAAALRAAAGPRGGVRELLRAHLARLRPGDYFALLAYVEMCGRNDGPLQELRHAVRDARRVATSLGYGPRFLHSTGQAYKGGPDTGVFLQVTCDDARDVPVPGEPYTFGVVKAAQARGDLQVLADRGRRALRAHLGEDVAAGLARLRELVSAALAG